jgi:hypothetical protein
MNEKLLDKIITAAYGRAGLPDRIAVWVERKRNPEAERIFREYRKTAEALKKMPKPECPDSILEKALIIPASHGRIKKRISTTALYYRRLAFGALTIVAVITVLLFYNKKEPVREPEYSRTEVEQAEQQAKAALAIVGQVLNNSNSILKNEIIYKQVSKPINNGIKTVNYIFRKGEKNESIN